MTEINQSKGAFHAGIIGGTSGIGLEIAKRLLLSCKVSSFGRRIEKLNGMKSACENLYIQYIDVQNDSSVQQGLESGVANFGKFDALIYCAGLQIIKPHRMLKIDDIDSLFNVNLRGALVASKLFCSSKFSGSDAVMCFVSSVAAEKPEAGIVAYSAMKAGLNALTKGLARESAPRRFVAVAPGWLDTEMTQKQPLYTPSYIEELRKRSPLGLTSVHNVVDAVEFLISKRASSITGEVLRIDGGAFL